MGACWTKTKDVINGLLVYDTVSIVRINDKRLAILHYLCMIIIVFYIVVYTVYLNQAYYRIEAPIGTVRINPMAPAERDNDTWTPIQDLNYCRTENRTSYHNFSLLNCKYFDSAIDVFPQAVDSTITIASRINYSLQNATNKDFDDPNSSWVIDNTELYFLADIERFTLQIDHTFYAPNLDIQNNAREITGKIVYDKDGKNEVKLCYPDIETVGRKTETDIISVCTLLKAAKVDIDAESVQPGKSIRYSGAIFLVFLDYKNNVDLLFRKQTRYTVQVKMISNTQYKAVQAVYTKKLESRTVYDRHGLHFVFLQTGQIVKFDFQVLLLSLVSGMGMLAVSTTIVDLVSTKVLGNKDVVSNLKYRTTPNLTQFSDEELYLLASKLRRTQEQELAINGNDSDLSDRDTDTSGMRLRDPLIQTPNDD